MTSDRHDAEVIVIGGGPAGSTAATWLARAGRDVVLLERERFPRFHIGESLLASVNDVLEEIGALGLVTDAGYPRKWGATFITSDGAVERFADFAVGRGVRRPQTWQVPRSHFDDLLLRHASQCGVDVRHEHRVTDVSFEHDGVSVSCQHSTGISRIRARAVVDASGRASVLARQFNLRVDEPRLRNVAIFSHFSAVPRATGRRAGDIRVIARRDLGWFWIIPISDELTSVGVVLPHETFKSLLSRADPEALLMQAIADTPAAARLLENAKRRWPVRVERDYSYASKTYAGDRWITVGDAGSFLDPVFSSGVAIALESGLEGAQAINEGLVRNALSARTFRRFNRRQRSRYLAFRRFVQGFYSTAFRDLFFSADPPPSLFSAAVTVLAGYWRPSLSARMWLTCFFLIVRMQARFGFAPSHLDSRPLAKGRL